MAFLKKRRGQAFETMMLVISVIVAIFILGILLGFLKVLPSFGTNAKDVIPDLVKKVSETGYGVETKDNVEFSVGDKIYQETARGQAAIPRESIIFACDDSSLGRTICSSSTGKSLYIPSSGTKIEVQSKISASISVCKGDGPNYYIVVGAKGNEGVRETSGKAEQLCGLAGTSST